MRLTEYHCDVAVIKNKNFFEAAQKLAKLEDEEESGKLLRLPYAQGQTIYKLDRVCRVKDTGYEDDCLTYMNCEECPRINELAIKPVKVNALMIYHYLHGKDVFSRCYETEEAAREALAKGE